MRSNEELDSAFGASAPVWPAFPDSADALRFLARHYRLAVLSNVHRDGFAASNRKLGVECGLHGGGYRFVQAGRREFRVSARAARGGGKMDRMRCTSRRACITILRMRTASASRTPGSTVSVCRRAEAGARRRGSKRCRRPNFSRWPRWPLRSQRRSTLRPRRADEIRASPACAVDRWKRTAAAAGVGLRPRMRRAPSRRLRSRRSRRPEKARQADLHAGPWGSPLSRLQPPLRHGTAVASLAARRNATFAA